MRPGGGPGRGTISPERSRNPYASAVCMPTVPDSHGKARAARLVEHGKPLRIEEVDLAHPGPDEVVVELAYAGVNPVDLYSALGQVARDAPVPRTLGREASGEVDGRAVVVFGHGLGMTRDGLWATRAT